MKKIYLLILICIGFKSYSQNLELKANLGYNGLPLANIGGYVDTAGNEYALVGTYDGLDIVDVTDPTIPVIKFTIPDVQSEWREVKTYKKFAYVTTEGGNDPLEADSGLTIIDLSGLPLSIRYKHYMGDGAIQGQLVTIHALHCDTTTGYLYLFGSNIDYGNSLFFNLADPWNPTYAGSYLFPPAGNGINSYVHDAYIENDTMYEAHIYSGFFTVVDVRDKANPLLLATQTTPTYFVHNTWLSDDHKTLFTTDENSGSFLTAYDISDLNNISELSRYQVTPGSGSIVHNTHVLNDYTITSWYKDGIVIVDDARPENPVEIAHYDTYPQGSGNGFNGCWGVYPFLPSGTIVASDIDNGLFVFKPTYVRGCYLEGTVRDSISNALLSGALVEILTTTVNHSTNSLGEFKTGTPNAGTYNVRFSKPGFRSDTVTGVQLVNGQLTQLDIYLSPLQTYAFSGSVSDSITTGGVANAEVTLEGNYLSYHAVADNDGLFTFPGVIPDTYTMNAGKWGYHSICKQVTLVQGMPLTAVLMKGYYDDFTFDFGWTVSGTSTNMWERADPLGSYDNNLNQINPENDVQSDCGTFCFVTDNASGPYNLHDVDNGNTILKSPIFDATIYLDPVVNYYLRYVDFKRGLNNPNDTMTVKLTNGITTVTIETLNPQVFNNGTWTPYSHFITPLITPTANMQLIVEVADVAPDNTVEGAFDQFEISGQIINKIPEVNSNDIHLNAYPNPFNNDILISYDLMKYTDSPVMMIKDITGRTIERREIKDHAGQVHMGEKLSPGIYLLILQNGNSETVKKIVKE